MIVDPHYDIEGALLDRCSYNDFAHATPEIWLQHLRWQELPEHPSTISTLASSLGKNHRFSHSSRSMKIVLDFTTPKRLAACYWKINSNRAGNCGACERSISSDGN